MALDLRISLHSSTQNRNPCPHISWRLTFCRRSSSEQDQCAYKEGTDQRDKGAHKDGGTSWAILDVCHTSARMNEAVYPRLDVGQIPSHTSMHTLMEEHS